MTIVFLDILDRIAVNEIYCFRCFQGDDSLVQIEFGIAEVDFIDLT